MTSNTLRSSSTKISFFFKISLKKSNFKTQNLKKIKEKKITFIIGLRGSFQQMIISFTATDFDGHYHHVIGWTTISHFRMKVTNLEASFSSLLTTSASRWILRIKSMGKDTFFRSEQLLQLNQSAEKLSGIPFLSEHFAQ